METLKNITYKLHYKNIFIIIFLSVLFFILSTIFHELGHYTFGYFNGFKDAEIFFHYVIPNENYLEKEISQLKEISLTEIEIYTQELKNRYILLSLGGPLVSYLSTFIAYFLLFKNIKNKIIKLIFFIICWSGVRQVRMGWINLLYPYKYTNDEVQLIQYLDLNPIIINSIIFFIFTFIVLDSIRLFFIQYDFYFRERKN